jgi:hypothetical protein
MEERIMNSQEMAKEYLNKLRERYKMECQMAELNRDIETRESKLYETMEMEGIDAITQDGIEFTPDISQKFKLNGYPERMSWDDVKEWFAWLKEVGESGIIKTKDSVHWKTRDAFLKGWVEAKRELPKFIQETFHPTVKYNKSAFERMMSDA